MKWFWYIILLINCGAGTMLIYAKIADSLPAGDYVGYLWFILSIGGLALTVKDDFIQK